MSDDTKKEEANQSEEAFPSAGPGELDACKKTCDEYLNNWKRAAADLINYKKDEAERASFLAAYAREDLIEKLLPIFDSFYLAQEQLPPEFKENSWVAGFNQIQNQIADVLKKEGIEEVAALGKPFNPETMEVVGEAEGSESGTVASVLQKGYQKNGRTIRAARVRVVK